MDHDRDTADDSALLRDARKGRPEAVAAILVRMRCIPRYLASIDRRRGRMLSAEDLADAGQQVFALVWSKADEYRGSARLETWVYSICRLTYANLVRRDVVRPRIARIEGDELVMPVAPRAFGDDLDDADLIRSLERLGPDSARIVALKLFDGLTFDEIALRLGISPNTAKSRHYRGLAELRERLRSV